MFFVIIGFLSLGILSYDYHRTFIEMELVSLGENKGKIFEERKELSTYEGIVESKKIYNNISLEKLNTIRSASNLIELEPYLYKSSINDFRVEHGVNSYVTTHGTEPTKINIPYKLNEKPIICIQDWFDDGDLHGEYIYNYVKSMYDGSIYLLDNNELNFNMHSYVNFYKYCDIVSMSIRFSEEFKEEHFLKNYGQYLKNKDTIFIYAAGNELSFNSEDEQELSKLKLNIQSKSGQPYSDINEALPNYFIGVTQGIVDTMKEEEVYRIYSGGKAIELIVLNGDLYIDSTKISGTSFATPFVTAMAANLLQAGVPKSEILNYLQSDYQLNDGKYTYSVVLADDIQNKINKFK